MFLQNKKRVIYSKLVLPYEKLVLPCYKSNRIQRSIKYQGVKVWNSIPVEIQNLPKSRFKIKLKSHLMQAYLKEIN